MPGFPSTLSLFGNEFNIFNNTGAQMLDSIYRMTLKLFFGVKKSRSCHLLCEGYNGGHCITLLINRPLVVYQFYCITLYHYQRRSHVIKFDSLHPSQLFFSHVRIDLPEFNRY